MKHIDANIDIISRKQSQKKAPLSDNRLGQNAPATERKRNEPSSIQMLTLLALAGCSNGSGTSFTDAEPTNISYTPLNEVTVNVTTDEEQSSSDFTHIVPAPQSAREGASITYEIVENDTDDSSAFSLDDEGVLRFAEEFKLDYESQSEFKVTVRVRNNDDYSQQYNHITITLDDRPDVAPFFSSPRSVTDLNDESDITSKMTIYQAEASVDPDGNQPRFFIKPDNDDDGHLLRIDPDTGAVSLKAILTPYFDIQSDYRFTVIARTENYETEHEVTLRYNDVMIRVETFDHDITEGVTKAPIVLAHITVNDDDYVFDALPDDRFALSDDGILSIKALSEFDFEAQKEVALTLTATAQGKADLTQDFVLTIYNIVDEPPVITSTDRAEAISEGDVISKDQIIYQAQTSEDDVTVTWDVSEEELDGTLFRADPETGAVHFKTAIMPDYEYRTSYEFTLLATSQYGTSSKKITVPVSDIIEPEFLVVPEEISGKIIASSESIFGTADQDIIYGSSGTNYIRTSVNNQKIGDIVLPGRGSDSIGLGYYEEKENNGVDQIIYRFNSAHESGQWQAYDGNLIVTNFEHGIDKFLFVNAITGNERAHTPNLEAFLDGFFANGGTFELVQQDSEITGFRFTFAIAGTVEGAEESAGDAPQTGAVVELKFPNGESYQGSKAEAISASIGGASVTGDNYTNDTKTALIQFLNNDDNSANNQQPSNQSISATNDITPAGIALEPEFAITMGAEYVFLDPIGRVNEQYGVSNGDETLSFSLQRSAGSANDYTLFDISSDGLLSVKDNVIIGGKDSYRFVVRAEQGDYVTLKLVTVIRPEIQRPLIDGQLVDHQHVIYAIDTDANATWSLQTGHDDEAHLFSIDRDTGEVRFAADTMIDGTDASDFRFTIIERKSYEVNHYHVTLSLMPDDKANWQVEVLEAGKAITENELITEDTALVSVIASPEAQHVVVTLDGKDASLFAYDASTGEVRFKNATVADYEYQDAYEISVIAVSEHGAIIRHITLSVSDVDEAEFLDVPEKVAGKIISSNDVIFGTEAQDIIYGGDDDNYISTARNNQTIGDIILPGRGTDTIALGYYEDKEDNGVDQIIYRFNSLHESGQWQAYDGNLTVTNFEHGIDKFLFVNAIKGNGRANTSNLEAFLDGFFANGGTFELLQGADELLGFRFTFAISGTADDSADSLQTGSVIELRFPSGETNTGRKADTIKATLGTLLVSGDNYTNDTKLALIKILNNDLGDDNQSPPSQSIGATNDLTPAGLPLEAEFAFTKGSAVLFVDALGQIQEPYGLMGENDGVSYRLEAWNNINVRSDYTFFTISDDGIVSTKTHLSFDEKDSYQFVIRAEQGDNLAYKFVTVKKPEIQRPMIDGQSVDKTTVIYAIDTKSNSSWSIQTGHRDEAHLFTIDANTGEVRFAADTTFERADITAFHFTIIERSDDAITQHSVALSVLSYDDLTLRIDVLDAASTVTENEPISKDTALVQVSTNPQLRDVVVTIEGADAALFSYDATTGEVRFNANTTPDYDDKQNYDFTLTARFGTVSITEQIIIAVKEVFEGTENSFITLPASGSDAPFYYLGDGNDVIGNSDDEADPKLAFIASGAGDDTITAPLADGAVIFTGLGNDRVEMTKNNGKQQFIYRYDSNHVSGKWQAYDGGLTITNFNTGHDSLLFVDMAGEDGVTGLHNFLSGFFNNGGKIKVVTTIKGTARVTNGFDMTFGASGTEDGALFGANTSNTLSIRFRDPNLTYQQWSIQTEWVRYYAARSGGDNYTFTKNDWNYPLTNTRKIIQNVIKNFIASDKIYDRTGGPTLSMDAANDPTPSELNISQLTLFTAGAKHITLDSDGRMPAQTYQTTLTKGTTSYQLLQADDEHDDTIYFELSEAAVLSLREGVTLLDNNRPYFQVIVQATDGTDVANQLVTVIKPRFEKVLLENTEISADDIIAYVTLPQDEANPIKWSIKPGQDDDGALFVIDDVTGYVRFAANHIADYEGRSSYELTIIADGASRYSEHKLTISVRNAQEWEESSFITLPTDDNAGIRYYGSAGQDVYEGTSAQDIIMSGDGNDRVNLVNGGDSHGDIIFTGFGKDEVTLSDNAVSNQILYRFHSQADDDEWQAYDGELVINNFKRGVDKLLLIDQYADEGPHNIVSFLDGFFANGGIMRLSKIGGQINGYDLVFPLGNTSDGLSTGFAAGNSLKIRFPSSISHAENNIFSTVFGSKTVFKGVDLTQANKPMLYSFLVNEAGIFADRGFDVTNDLDPSGLALEAPYDFTSGSSVLTLDADKQVSETYATNIDGGTVTYHLHNASQSNRSDAEAFHISADGTLTVAAGRDFLHAIQPEFHITIEARTKSVSIAREVTIKVPSYRAETSIAGSETFDYIDGTTHSDIIYGGDGNDEIIAGVNAQDGENIYLPGRGRDSIILQKNSDVDHIIYRFDSTYKTGNWQAYDGTLTVANFRHGVDKFTFVSAIGETRATFFDFKEFLDGFFVSGGTFKLTEQGARIIGMEFIFGVSGRADDSLDSYQTGTQVQIRFDNWYSVSQSNSIRKSINGVTITDDQYASDIKQNKLLNFINGDLNGGKNTFDVTSDLTPDDISLDPSFAFEEGGTSLAASADGQVSYLYRTNIVDKAVSYSLSGSKLAGDDYKRFEITQDGILRLKEGQTVTALDKDVYQLVIRAHYGDKIATKSVTITKPQTVTSLRDAQTFTTSTALYAIDKDAEDARWSLKIDNNDDAGLFTINSETGVVRFASDTVIDYATKESYHFTIIREDTGEVESFASPSSEYVVVLSVAPPRAYEISQDEPMSKDDSAAASYDGLDVPDNSLFALSVFRDQQNMLDGGPAAELIQGGGHNDSLRSAGGADVIIGGYGDDVITLGVGAQTILYRFGVGADGFIALDGGDLIKAFELGTDKLLFISVTQDGATPLEAGLDAFLDEIAVVEDGTLAHIDGLSLQRDVAGDYTGLTLTFADTYGRVGPDDSNQAGKALEVRFAEKIASGSTIATRLDSYGTKPEGSDNPILAQYFEDAWGMIFTNDTTDVTNDLTPNDITIF